MDNSHEISEDVDGSEKPMEGLMVHAEIIPRTYALPDDARIVVSEWRTYTPVRDEIFQILQERVSLLGLLGITTVSETGPKSCISRTGTETADLWEGK